MREITLDSITSEQVSDEARVLVDMLRTRFPRLDLRRGTALRDLLVDADAAVGAMYREQAAEQLAASSLKELSEREAAGEPVDQADVDAAMSNFNMESVGGTKASGYVKVVVSTGDDHTVLAGVGFRNAEGMRFVTTRDVTASSTGKDAYRQWSGSGTDRHWYVVPVEADEPGVAGNLKQGSALTPEIPLADFVSASAYKTFSGGSDMEPLQKTVSRIRQSLSARSLTTASAVEAELRDEFDSTGNPIVAVSLCGFGDAEQLRDKHNAFGVAVGGRVDAYIRNFTSIPVVQSIERDGELFAVSSDEKIAKYVIPVSHADVPGMVSIRSVTDPESSSLSSFPYEVEWGADSASRPWGWHDIDVSADPREVANTVWRDAVVTVEAPYDPSNEARSFVVEVVVLPDAARIQSYMDDGLVRNVASDFVARCPMIVNVSVSAVVRHGRDVSIDDDEAKTRICDYVNSLGFVGRLTRSEISSILIGMGATSVDLYDENVMLHGYVYDALGTRHDLSGDALDMDLITDPKAMLTKRTCVFVVEPSSISIRKVLVG